MCLISSTELEILRLVANTNKGERKVQSFKKQEAKSSWEESLQSSVPGGFNAINPEPHLQKTLFQAL